MPRKRSEAVAAQTGRTWSPIKGLTITERGVKQFQVRVRRTGWPSQTQTFETAKAGEAWGIGVLDGYNKNTFVDRRTEARTTLTAVLDHYLATGVEKLKSRVQAASQVRQLKNSMLAPRYVGDITTADVIEWLERRRRDTVLRKARDADGRVVKTADGRRRVVQHVERLIGEKTVLNELMRLSAVFEHARIAMNMPGLVNPTTDVPAKNRPKRTERTRRLVIGERERLLTACRESRSAHLAAIVELALETASRRSEIVMLLRWEDIDLERQIAVLRGTKSIDGSFRTRTIGLSDRAVEILRARPGPREGRVFDVRPDNISRNFRVACERAGIANLTLHDQRSEAASVMAQVQGLDIVELADQGGWKSLQVLRKYYRPDPTLIAKKLNRKTPAETA